MPRRSLRLSGALPPVSAYLDPQLEAARRAHLSNAARTGPRLRTHETKTNDVVRRILWRSRDRNLENAFFMARDCMAMRWRIDVGGLVPPPKPQLPPPKGNRVPNGQTQAERKARDSARQRLVASIKSQYRKQISPEITNMIKASIARTFHEACLVCTNVN